MKEDILIGRISSIYIFTYMSVCVCVCVRKQRTTRATCFTQIKLNPKNSLILNGNPLQTREINFNSNMKNYTKFCLAVVVLPKIFCTFEFNLKFNLFSHTPPSPQIPTDIIRAINFVKVIL